MGQRSREINDPRKGTIKLKKRELNRGRLGLKVRRL